MGLAAQTTAPDTAGNPSDAETLARLRLIRSENVGPVTFARLLERYGNARVALEALPGLAGKGGRAKPLRICSRAEAEAEIAELHALGARIICKGTVGYPPLLGHIDDAPPVIFVRGHPGLLSKKAVALVGSRNASVNGRRFARQMAMRLGQAGYLVVSGMARGIDTAAHVGALETGTAAVMGGGVDVCYPRENQDLYDDLIRVGAVCTEVRVGTQPQARHFPRRNRIISGMARAIVVLEAGARSGSLITARMALEQGREVFAVPGAPQDSRVKGSNALIRDGAVLTEDADDVIRVLAEMDARVLNEDRTPSFGGAEAAPVPAGDVDAARGPVMQALGFGPTDIDEIIRETACAAAAVHVVLLELEVAGGLERQAGNRVALIAS
ncbi:MAG: DNA-protecting protein DprA [Rhodospirillales bacterium]|nr:DNA-protecting protein DprA [Rhodospirillales bacterium]MBO6785950.1 DNA-protecting protein DprA [Rhodospirillales bacterium]